MSLACSWSEPSFGPLGCWPFASAQGRLRCPTLAPSVSLPDRVQKGKGLQLSQAAAQAITIVICWLSQHFGAYPPTSRMCYRSTAKTRMLMSMLLVSLFLPSRISSKIVASSVQASLQLWPSSTVTAEDGGRWLSATVTSVHDNGRYSQRV